ELESRARELGEMVEQRFNGQKKQMAAVDRSEHPPFEISIYFLMNLPCRSSENASCNCSWVFITMGPYQATGSSIGLPETRRKRIPSSPASTTTSSPRSKRTSERLPVCSRTRMSLPPSF